MNKYITISFVMCFLMIGQIIAQEEIEVGERKTIRFYESVDVTPSGAIEVSETPDRTSVVVTGMREGTGVLDIRYRASGRQETKEFRVYTRKPEKVIEELRELFRGVEGITFTKAGGKVIAKGKFKSEVDKVIYDRIMKLYPDVIDMTEKTDLLIEISAIVIEVTDDNSFSFNLNPMPMDSLGLASALLRKSGQITNGLTWAVSLDVLQSISTLISSGKAKVISNPRIVTNNTKKAEILSGGELAYVSGVSPQGVPIIAWKSYGIKLEVTPERKTTGEIFMDLYVESSNPIEIQKGVNSISSRNARIQVSVKNGSSLVIGGLFNDYIDRTNRAGCLWPIFGFGWSKQHKEILIVVTPKETTQGIPIQKFNQIKEDYKNIEK